MPTNTSGAAKIYRGKSLATKKTPATTIVAAWINADTGVGPSIASGNHMCKGNIADFPAPPIKIRAKAQLITEAPIKVTPAALANTDEFPEVRTPKSNVPVK